LPAGKRPVCRQPVPGKVPAKREMLRFHGANLVGDLDEAQVTGSRQFARRCHVRADGNLLDGLETPEKRFSIPVMATAQGEPGSRRFGTGGDEVVVMGFILALCGPKQARLVVSEPEALGSLPRSAEKGGQKGLKRGKGSQDPRHIC
jgi:hypothetical protein